MGLTGLILSQYRVLKAVFSQYQVQIMKYTYILVLSTLIILSNNSLQTNTYIIKRFVLKTISIFINIILNKLSYKQIQTMRVH